MGAIQALAHQVLDHARIGKRGNVSELIVLVRGNLAQDAAHDLAGTGLGQPRRPLNEIRRGDRADLFPDPVTQLVPQRFGRFLAGVQRDVHVDARALDVMRHTDRGGFGAQYVIAITVRRFEAEYGADPNAAPTAQVVLECTVGNRNNRTTVASFDVATSAPAADNRLGEVVAALDRAANDAVTQVIERTAGVVAGAGSAAR